MKALLLLTVVCSGLVAGLLYGYSCSVNPGLKSLADSEYIKAMQSINIAIQNPFFFAVFMGLLLLFPITSYQFYQQHHTALSLVVAAMFVYFVGVFGVTAFCNVPLNNQLAKFSVLAATPTQLSAMRQSFEKHWNTYHAIRTIASLASFALLVLMLLKQKLPQ